MEWVLIVIFVIIILFSFLSSSSSDFIGWPLFSNAERSFFGGLTQALGNEYKVTTQRKHNDAVADNLLNMNFNPIETNHVWAGMLIYK